MPHCPNCGREIAGQSLERIVDLVMTYPQDSRINVLAPIVRGRKGEFKKELQAVAARGFTKARIDGEFKGLDDDLALNRRKNHAIDVVVDRLIVRSGIERRLAESVQTALGLADGVVVVNALDSGDRLFSRKLACVVCGISVPEMSPRAFSFNSPHGACPACQGLGAPGTSTRAGWCPTTASRSPTARSRRGAAATRSWSAGAIGHRRAWGIDPAVPFGKLPKKQRDLLLSVLAPGRGAETRRRPRKRRRSAASNRTARTSKASSPTCAAASTKRHGRCRPSSTPYRALRECPSATARGCKAESRAVRSRAGRSPTTWPCR